MMNIEVKYYVARGDFQSCIELEVPLKGITAIFGPSGCGKTTLLRAIAGLDYHHGAYIKIGANAWQKKNYFLPTHKRKLAYVFQEACLFSHLNVRENIEYGYKRIAKPDRRIEIQHAIELLGVNNLLERKAHQLSGGERQRVAIARALGVSPELLLMDEPLAALDLQSKRDLLPYIESLAAELAIPVIYVSHSHNEVARLADGLVLMENGKVLATGNTSELFSRLDLSLAHDHDAAAIIDADVMEYDVEFDLTRLQFAGGQITVTGKTVAIGDRVRLRLAARDVSLTLERQHSTSILNIFPATIDAIFDEQSAQVTIRLLAEGVPILSRITRKSALQLELRKGDKVYAQVKSVALLS